MNAHALERISTWALIAGIVLLPVAFLPGSVLPLVSAKAGLVLLAVFIALAAYLAHAWSDRVVRVPRSLIIVGLWALVAVSLLSALFSNVPMTALIGQGFESDTVFMLTAGALLASLTALCFRKGDRQWQVYLGLAAAFALIVLYHLIRFVFGAETLAFGLFGTQTQNMVGSWNDLGIFATLISLLSLLTLIFVPFKGVARVVTYVLLALSLAFVLLVNYPLLWYIIGAAGLMVGLYAAIKKQPRNLLVTGAVVLAVAILGITLGSTIVNTFSRVVPISVVEARPGWSVTFDIGKRVFNSGQYLGSGPNHFMYEWLRLKPIEVNANQYFWNTDFIYGVGYAPSFLITTGFLGVAAWLLILAAVCMASFRAIRHKTTNVMSTYFLNTSMVGAVFLTLAVVLYMPSLTIIGLWFAFLGLFVAALSREGLIREWRIERGEGIRGKVMFVVLGVLTLIAVLFFVVGGTRIAANMLAQRAVFAANTTGATVQPLQTLDRAISLAPTSLYYRTQASLYYAQLSQVVAKANAAGSTASEADTEALRTEFQAAFAGMNQSIQFAIEKNPYDYQNYLLAANAYATLASLGNTVEFDNAVLALQKAKEFNPTSPLIPLAQARIEAGRNRLDSAETFITEAIEKKPNYIDAYFFLAQVQVANKDTPAAIVSVEKTIAIEPTNPLLRFQLGLLYYNTKAYRTAATALEQAVTLTPVYANARYFLGLTYEKLGRTAEALEQFKAVAETNPESEEVKKIIANLNAGRAPLSGIEAESEPEVADELPVTETEN